MADKIAELYVDMTARGSKEALAASEQFIRKTKEGQKEIGELSKKFASATTGIMTFLKGGFLLGFGAKFASGLLNPIEDGLRKVGEAVFSKLTDVFTGTTAASRAAAQKLVEDANRIRKAYEDAAKGINESFRGGPWDEESAAQFIQTKGKATYDTLKEKQDARWREKNDVSESEEVARKLLEIINSPNLSMTMRPEQVRQTRNLAEAIRQLDYEQEAATRSANRAKAAEEARNKVFQDATKIIEDAKSPTEKLADTIQAMVLTMKNSDGLLKPEVVQKRIDQLIKDAAPKPEAGNAPSYMQVQDIARNRQLESLGLRAKEIERDRVQAEQNRLLEQIRDILKERGVQLPVIGQ